MMGNNGMMGGNLPMPRMTPPRPMMAPRTQYLPGRFINNESEIVAGEIPMDGSISFFCTNDLSKIIIKQWNNSGLLDTMTYSLDMPNQVNNTQAQTQNNQQPQMPDPPPPPNQQQMQQPDALSEIQAGMKSLSDTIESAFNNLAGTMQQSLNAINAKLENYDHGQG